MNNAFNRLADTFPDNPKSTIEGDEILFSIKDLASMMVKNSPAIELHSYSHDEMTEYDLDRQASDIWDRILFLRG